ncbi:MAG: response regulator, partial [Bacteroidetes bacterium]|nr:response regulator [Bacteroidota bacterium]
PLAPEEKLWIGTAGGGLNLFDKENERFIHITEKDGLPNDVVYGILPDEKGNLWLSTNKGLSKYKPAKNQFTNYDVNDGLQSNEFNTGAYYKSRSGELFFGGINGFNYFFPGKIGNKKSIPKLVFTEFKLFNKSVSVRDSNSVLQKTISETGKMKLSYAENVISFEFASLDYYAPTKNQYAYKLKGFNEEWIQLGTKREVSFTNLDPGEYVLRVKGTNSDGVWNEKGASIRIIITPPIWQTWWAYLLYVFVLLTGLYLIRRYELNRVNLKNQLKFEKVESKSLREIDQMKSRFFTNISHEFRTPLTLILGQIDSLQSSIKDLKNRGKLQVAHKNAKRVLRLINQLLDLSKLESGSLELKAEPHNIVSFLKSLFYSFESLADKKSIKLSFTSEQEKVFVNIEPDKMEKVFYNLVSNAFKFTAEGGEIAIKIFEVDDNSVIVRQSDSESQRSNLNRGKLFQTNKATDSTIKNKYAAISIKDTGIGIPEDRLSNIFNRFYQVDNLQTSDYEGTGIGLALAKELVELHKGIISVNSKEDEGTEFVIYLPISKETKQTQDQVTSVDQPQKASTERVSKEFQDQLEDELSNLVDEPQDRPINGNDIDRQIILVVEDNQDVRAYICEQLESKYSVIQAMNGEDGIVEAQESIPDLIITDVMMPKMDGFEFSKKIRRNEKTSHIPIIMLTAKASLDDKIEGLETGVDAYLTKPFSTKELIARVSNLIHQREQLRKRFRGKTIIRPSDVTAASIDQTFLEKVIKTVDVHIEDEQFNVDKLADEVCMSVSQLNRKLRALIDQPAGQLIRSMRLNRAAGLLKQNVGSVAEICYMVGFNDQSYFTRTFKKQFGHTPSEFKKNKNTD